MALDKAIKSRKEHRKPYYGAKANDATCRNHGSCRRCIENRLYSTTKRMASIKDKMREYELSCG